MNKKKFIILTGGDTGANNLGDQWILDGVKRFYKTYLDDYNIVIMMDGDISSFDDGFIYINDNKESFEKLSIDISKIQLLHYYGGGYLNDYWFDWKIWQYYYLINEGLPFEKVVFTDLGIGPFNDSIKFNRLAEISSKVKFFGLRDKNFIEKVEKSFFMFDRSVSLINPYMVFLYNLKKVIFKFFFKSKKKILINFRPGSKSDYVGVESNDYKSLFKKILDLKNNNKYDSFFSFFPMMENSWLSEIDNFKKIVGLNTLGNVNIINRPHNYKSLLRMVSGFNLLITTSYHAALAGIYSGVPVVGIYNTEYYKDKFIGISNIIPSPYFICLNINDFSSENILKLLNCDVSPINSSSLVTILLDLKKINVDHWNNIKGLL